MTSKADNIAAQTQEEIEDAAHEVSYTIHCKFSAKVVTADQREAMASLVREKATEIQTFATLIAGGNHSVTTLTKRSSAKGQKTLDFGYAV